MNYLLRNNQAHRPTTHGGYARKILILVAILLLSLILASTLNWLLVRILVPIWWAENTLVMPAASLVEGSIPVLTRPPQSPYDTLILGRWVEIGTEVLSEESTIGRVYDTSGGTSKVKLFSAPLEETSATLERTGSLVTLRGRGAGNFRIEVPREEPVVEGDRILSISDTPRLIGVVEQVRVEPTDAFKEVLARVPVNIFTISYVRLP